MPALVSEPPAHVVETSLVDRTHGRWPWLAAAAAPPATALVLARREWLAEELRWTLWLPLPVLLWHQTEEWVAPLATAGLRALVRDQRAPTRQVAAGALAGVAGSIGMMAAMRFRLRTAKRDATKEQRCNSA